MKMQTSINLEQKDLTALRQLAIMQYRSLSDMGAICIRQRLAQLRAEYRQDPTLPSLPKHDKYTSRLWDQHYREIFG